MEGNLFLLVTIESGYQSKKDQSIVCIGNVECFSRVVGATDQPLQNGTDFILVSLEQYNIED